MCVSMEHFTNFNCIFKPLFVFSMHNYETRCFEKAASMCWLVLIKQFTFKGFPKLAKSCSHFYQILPITADIKAGCTYIGCNVEIGYSVQGLVAKVKDTVANGYFG